MDARFRRVDRDQQFLLPPDVREWLAVGHAALFLVELIESLDLSGFVARAATSRDRGRPAYHPAVMVGIALYASMTATMSSRRIERALATDVGFRVVAANERPDHVTICRFLTRHRDLLEGLFAQVVGLAAEAGLIDVTLIAVDGTKMAGDASPSRSQRLGDLRARYAGWADDVGANDAADDAADAADPDDGPIPEMLERDSMREWIQRRLRERADEPDDRKMNVTDPDSGLVPRSGGGWVQGYNAQAAAVAGGIVVAADVTANPADTTMLAPMVQRIGDAVAAATGQMAGVVVADAGYWTSEVIEDIEAEDELPDVLIATGRHTPDQSPDPLPEPDLAAHHAAVADYEAAVAAERARRIAVIARVVNGELLIREGAELLGLSVPHVGALKLAWQQGADEEAVSIQRLPGRPRPRPPKGPTRAARSRHAMDTRLARPAGRSLYRQRQAVIEPVFGDIKTNRRITRFLRRGHETVRAEWHSILTGHNLTILHRRTT
ncbi:MAG: transposase [Actinomycetota bacterium]|nr:transposase [Acidimicrobiia bacterium]MDQ3470676.1 transposase [Actinomycetota bacterium]